MFQGPWVEELRGQYGQARACGGEGGGEAGGGAWPGRPLTIFVFITRL